MRNFLMQFDANKRDTGAIPHSDTIYDLVMTGGVEKVVTVPTGANMALFSSTGNFYCKFGATVAVPVADVTDGSGGELNPTIRVVTNITTIHMIASNDCIITIAFYNVPMQPFITSGFPYVG